MSAPSMMIKLDLIRTDGGTQPREQMDENWVNEIADSIVNGDTMPPVIVFHDGTDYWLADGFHRVRAHRKLRRREIEADIRQGTNRDAILFSCGANSGQTALPRTNKDKRHAVLTLLRDAQPGCLPGHHSCTGKAPAEMCWSLLSDRDISRRCGVSQPFVSKLRAEIEPAGELSDNGYQIEPRAAIAALSGNGCQIEPRVTICEPLPERPRVVERKGSLYVQQTANIGRAETISQKAQPRASSAPAASTAIPDGEAMADEVFEFVDALCGRLQRHGASLNLEYFLPLVRAFPADITVAEVLRLIEKRAAELSIAI
jgi:hypothetical protein